MQNYNNIKHDSVKINAYNVITFKIKERTMNEKSIKNLTGKKQSGYLSKRAAYEIENTVLNFLTRNSAAPNAHQVEDKKEEKPKIEITDGLPQYCITFDENTEGGYIRRDANTQPNLTDKKRMFFGTLTADQDSTTIEGERKLFKAFRHFLKTASEQLELQYIWKCEKSTDSHQHFHIIGDGHTDSDLTKSIPMFWRNSCFKNNIICHNYSSSVVWINESTDDFKRLGKYMSKQTERPIDSRLFGMSNNMQKFKSTIIKRDEKKVTAIVDGLNIITETPRYTVFAKNTEGSPGETTAR
jgi:hypothetical protein